MRKNISILGIIIGMAMLIFHFLPWAATATKTGSAFSEGMNMLLTIPNYVSVTLALLFFIYFLLIQAKIFTNAKVIKALTILLSILIAACAIVNIATLPNNFGTMIVGEGYSFGFGEKTSIAFGVYLLAAAALLGIAIGFIYPGKSVTDSKNI